MKKTVIAIAVAGFASLAVQAAPQANTFYTGARLGWSSVHYEVNRFNSDVNGTKLKRNDVTYGAYFGYQIIDNLAVELAYDNFGGFKSEYRKTGNTELKMRNHGASLTFKPSIALTDNFDAYLRLGAAYVRSDYKSYENGTKDSFHTYKWSPVYAAGFEYAPVRNLGIRLEYSWLDQVSRLKEEDGSKFNPRIGAVTLGVSYRFGQDMPVAPVQVSQTFALNSDVMFGFNKTNLKPEAEAELTDIYAQISGLNVQRVAINGYTDRIGPEATNLRISKERAEAVANFLENKGLSANTMVVNGHGSADPVVQCDKMRGKTLIKCLAPNRRVQIVVDGTK